MKCFIFGALDTEKVNILPQKNDFVIACDRGLLNAQKLGILPDYIIGDFDSLGYTPNGKNCIELPVCKDDTDTAYAIKFAVDLGADEFYVFGASGGKLDHSFANIQLSQFYAEKGIKTVFFGKTNFCSIHNEKLVFDQKANGRISVFSGSKNCRVTIKNLKYELNDYLMTDFPIGVSNEFVGKVSEITANDGTVTVMWEDSVIPKRYLL